MTRADDPDLSIAFTKSMATLSSPDILYIVRGNGYFSQAAGDTSFPLWITTVLLHNLIHSGLEKIPISKVLVTLLHICRVPKTLILPEIPCLAQCACMLQVVHDVLRVFHNVLQVFHDLVLVFHDAMIVIGACTLSLQSPQQSAIAP